MNQFALALGGTIIGGLLTLAGSFLQNYFSLRREREQWQRQQEAEERKYKHELQQKEAAQRLETYTNSIHYLSLLTNRDLYESEEYWKDFILHRAEAQQWVSQLFVIHRGDSFLEDPFRKFMEATPESTADAASNLRDEVFSTLSSDKVLGSTIKLLNS